MYKRRRKFKGTWLPVFGSIAGSDQVVGTGIQGNLAVPLTGEIVTTVGPVTADAPEESIDEVTTSAGALAGIVGSEWALRRIVGKFVAGLQPDEGGEFVKVCLGFFVARADSEASVQPIGTQSPNFDSTDSAGFHQYSPLSQQTQREPWIWRRTWVLANAYQEGGAGGTQLAPIHPTSTQFFGSVADGPHVDAKTRRRIGQDDRLFYAISAAIWPYQTSEDQGELQLAYDLDVRLFGALRRSRQRGAF